MNYVIEMNMLQWIIYMSKCIFVSILFNIFQVYNKF